jgi:hypothetical protein
MLLGRERSAKLGLQGGELLGLLSSGMAKILERQLSKD